MSSNSRFPRRYSNLLLMVPFLGFYYVQLVDHVLWRDEFNAWAIACVSDSWTELFRRVHYEAHPALWYAVLYVASRASHAAWMLKAVQGAIGTAIYFVLALTTPFRRLELALIFAGYYISFQYTVMCRMYGLEVLFALIYVWSRMRRPEWMVCNALWLGLIANTDASGGILSMGLLIEYFGDRYEYHRQTGALKPAQFVTAAATYMGLVAISIASLWPAKDIGWATGRMFSEFGSMEHLGGAFTAWAGLAFFPQTMDAQTLWNYPHPWPHALIVPLVLLLVYGVFRTHRRLGWMLIAIALMGIFFSQATNVAGVRHIGIGYIAFLVALWMMRYQGERVSNLSYALLALTVIATLSNIRAQWDRPFADDDAAAQWIVQNHLQNMPLMGTLDTNTIGVPERLGRPMYQLECNCFDRVLTFSRRRNGFNRDTDVPARVILGMKNIGVPSVLFLMYRPLTDAEQSALSEGHVTAEPIAKFDKGYVADEHFYVYRLASNRP